MGLNKIWGAKIVGIIIIWSRRYYIYFFLRSTKFWVQENFGSKKCMVQKKLWVIQNFGFKKILAPKIFWEQKILSPKKFWPQKVWHFPDTLFTTSWHPHHTQQASIRQLPNTFHRCSIHLTDTLQTPSKTLQTLFRSAPETFQTPYRHNQDTPQTPSRQTLDNHKKPVKFKQFWDIFKTPS